MIARGQTTGEIADALGVAPNTVDYHRTREPARDIPVSDLRYSVGNVTTREAVAAMLVEGLSQAEIARRLGVTKSTVSYHAKRLGKPRDERGARRYDWVAVQAYYDCGFTVRECSNAFGFSHETWHAAVKRGDIVPRSGRIPNDELFAYGVRRDRGHLKLRILKDNLKPACCARCGLTKWRDRPISLALHHINGDARDNRLENLELLCPNCHSQTENFAGRNGHRTPGLAVSE